MTIPDTHDEKVKVNEGIVLAGISASAYLLAFLYEDGFASVFNIPLSLISISINNILIFGAAFIGALIAIFPILNLLTIYMSNPPFIFPYGRFTFFIVLYLIGIIFIYGIENWKYWLLSIIVSLIIVFFIYLFPLITQRRERKKYLDKLIAQADYDRKIVDIFDLLSKRFGKDLILILVIFIAGISLSYNAGIAKALNQKEFLVTETAPEMVVLKIYGDNFICAPFDRSTKEVVNTYKIGKLSNEKGLTFTLENVGPLHTKSINSALPVPTATIKNTPLSIPSKSSTNAITVPLLTSTP